MADGGRATMRQDKDEVRHVQRLDCLASISRGVTRFLAHPLNGALGIGMVLAAPHKAMITLLMQTHVPEPHLVENALGLGVHDLLQHVPVGVRDVLGDAAAALQIELVHLLADVVAQHRRIAADCLLECTDWRACVHVSPLQYVSRPFLTQDQQGA